MEQPKLDEQTREEIRQIVRDEISKVQRRSMIDRYGLEFMQGLAQAIEKDFPNMVPDLPELKLHER